MKEILGLAVLTSPLFLVVPWLLVAVLVAVKVSQLLKMGVAKLAAGAATFVLVFLLPFSDDIAGRIYLNRLCSTEAGVKVYQTVELPAEYWDVQGNPRFYVNRYGDNKLRFIFPDKTMIDAPQFEYTWVTTSYSGFFHIDKDVLQITSREKNAKLGDYNLFRYWGGWLARDFSTHNSAISCEMKDFNIWELGIFKPATSAR